MTGSRNTCGGLISQAQAASKASLNAAYTSRRQIRRQSCSVLRCLQGQQERGQEGQRVEQILGYCNLVSAGLQ